MTLDCQAHKITRLTVTSATNVHVTNCTFTGVNDVYTSTQVQVTSSAFITNSVLQLHNTSQSLVSGNTFTADQTITGSVQLDDINGQNNVISQNTLDGAGAYVNSKAVGFDDGIFLAGASGDLVQGNHLAHYWDCGIETTNLVTNTTFSGNTVDSAPKALGAWYWSSWVNNTVQANTFTNVSFGWYMFNEYGPATQGTTVVYFTGNHFTNNTVSFDTSPNQPDVVIKVDVSEAPYYDPVTGQPITITPTVTASGNVFTGNNLGTVRFAPSLVPESAFVDGGGNICGPPPTALEPIHC